MKRSAQIGLALGVLFASPCLADSVYLTNGSSFENVIAQRTAHGVRIVLPYGDLTLPADRVARIVSSESPLAQFLARFEALRAATNAGTADWLRLGTWALDHGLTASATKSALRAAELSPKEPAVAALMRRLDYRYDPELARWIPIADYLRRRGFVREGGVWLSPQEVERRAAAARSAAQAAAAAEQARDERETSDLLKAAAILAISNSAASDAQQAPSAGMVWPVASFPAFYGYALHQRRRATSHPARVATPRLVRGFQVPTASANYGIYNRPPGSLENANLYLLPPSAPSSPPGRN